MIESKFAKQLAIFRNELQWGGRLWVVNVRPIPLWILSQLSHVSSLIGISNVFNLFSVVTLFSIVIDALGCQSVFATPLLPFQTNRNYLVPRLCAFKTLRQITMNSVRVDFFDHQHSFSKNICYFK